MREERLRLVREIPDISALDELRSLFWAFVACLNPEETSFLLPESLYWDKYKRRALLARITKDIESGYESHHEEMMARLYSSFHEGPARHAQKVVAVLRPLFPHLPRPIQCGCAKILLQPRWVNPRRSTYPLLRDSWKQEFDKIVQEAWHRFRDPECSELIAHYADPRLLEQEYEELLPQFRGRRLLSMIKRLPREHRERALKYVRSHDEITYVYLLAMLRVPLPSSEATRIYVNNCQDRRLGLLIWAFGQLSLWEALVEVSARIKADVRQRVEDELVGEPFPGGAR